ncbi:MAG: DUF1517 domain-containing protein, partial [Myxococcales bacterium]|nr:DUF1517 domain-containing protein [Myxococcales bacterium]
LGAAVVAWLLLSGTDAFAQRSGSSFGGGSWSRSRSSGSSSSSSSWHSSSSSSSGSSSRRSRSSSYSSGSSGSSTGGLSLPDDPYARNRFWILLGTFGALALVVGYAVARPREVKTAVVPVARSEGAIGGVDLAIVSVGIDARARPFLQRKLAALAHEADLSNPIARAAALRQTLVALRSSRGSWAYGAVRDTVPMEAEHAQPAFENVAADYRARYRDELIRGASSGVVAREDGGYRASAHEGEGLVVVTVIVAKWGSIADTAGEGIEAIDVALGGLASIAADELVAFEVIWSPAADADRMSSLELATLYPELKPFRPDHFGRVSCAHCGTHHARELSSCPLCGAPAAS